MRKQITHISVAQTAKVFAALYFTIAVVVALCFLIAYVLGKHSLPFVGIVLFPFIYAAIIWVVFAFVCWLYNTVAQRVGGVEFEVRDIGAGDAAP